MSCCLRQIRWFWRKQQSGCARQFNHIAAHFPTLFEPGHHPVIIRNRINQRIKTRCHLIKSARFIRYQCLCPVNILIQKRQGFIHIPFNQKRLQKSVNRHFRSMFSSVHHQGTLTKYPGKITKTGIGQPEKQQQLWNCGFKRQKSFFSPVKKPVSKTVFNHFRRQNKTGHRNKSPGTVNRREK